MESVKLLSSFKLTIMTSDKFVKINHPYKLQPSLRLLKYSTPCLLLLNQLKVVSYPPVTYGDYDEVIDGYSSPSYYTYHVLIRLKVLVLLILNPDDEPEDEDDDEDDSDDDELEYFEGVCS